MSSETRLKLALAAIALLLAGGALGYWLAQPRGDRAAEVAPAGSGGKQGERKILYWHDPMVPNARFDKPGKSPFMNMDLVPVYADEELGAAVRVNPALAQNLGIRLGTVETALLNPTLSVVGSVAF